MTNSTTSKPYRKKFAVAALAAVLVTAGVPATSFAHGGGRHNDGGRGSNQQRQVQTQNGSRFSNFMNRRHHDGRGWGMYCLSAEKFQQRYDAILARLDSIVADNNLSVENGTELRANVVTTADVAKTKTTELKALKDQYNNQNVTDEQRDAFKAKLQETRQALMEYRDALRAYKDAIKTAADQANVDVSFKVSAQVK